MTHPHNYSGGLRAPLISGAYDVIRPCLLTAAPTIYIIAVVVVVNMSFKSKESDKPQYIEPLAFSNAEVSEKAGRLVSGFREACLQATDFQEATARFFLGIYRYPLRLVGIDEGGILLRRGNVSWTMGHVARADHEMLIVTRYTNPEKDGREDDRLRRVKLVYGRVDSVEPAQSAIEYTEHTSSWDLNVYKNDAMALQQAETLLEEFRVAR
jgi:hypothetical protein